jgi:hypothetical protein
VEAVRAGQVSRRIVDHGVEIVVKPLRELEARLVNGITKQEQSGMHAEMKVP